MNTTNLGEYLKLNAKHMEPHEIVVAIIALAKAGHIKVEAIRPLIIEAFDGDTIQAIQGLSIASEIIDQDLIEAILN